MVDYAIYHGWCNLVVAKSDQSGHSKWSNMCRQILYTQPLHLIEFIIQTTKYHDLKQFMVSCLYTFYTIEHLPFRLMHIVFKMRKVQKYIFTGFCIYENQVQWYYLKQMFATHAYASNISNKLFLKSFCKFCAIISSEIISKTSVDTLTGAQQPKTPGTCMSGRVWHWPPTINR